MNREEVEEEASETHLRVKSRQATIETGHLVTLGLAILLNAIMVAFSYGSMMQKVDNNTDAIALVRSRDITPGAERRIAVLENSVSQIKSDGVEWRREVREQLNRIEEKVDAVKQVVR